MPSAFDGRCPGCHVHLVTPLDESQRQLGPGILRLSPYKGSFYRVRERRYFLICHLCGTVIVQRRRVTVQFGAADSLSERL
jgi:hypothetical protein